MGLLAGLNDALERLSGRRLSRPAEATHPTGPGGSLWDFRRALATLPEESQGFASFAVPRLLESQAQFLQDLWVLHETGLKRNGFFVEFGATDGVSISNTFLLERDYGWTGILAEPNPAHQTALAAGRRAAIDARAVWITTGQRASLIIPADPDLATLGGFAETDLHGASRADHRTVTVETVSLRDLLDTHHAPEVIDFMSIDTEGSELDILAAYDFSRPIRCISVEHNFSANRDRLHDLLSAQGYVRRHPDLSAVDDWYLHQEASKPQV